jgi:GNAT superfamily N-acetyltransferase
MSDVRLEPLTRDRVASCAALHLAAFPDFFLSRLGERFLREFYTGFVDDHDAVTAVALDPSGRVLGVVVGTVRPSGFFSRLLRRRWYAFAWAAAALVLRDPRHLPRLVRAVAYRGQVPVDVSGALLSSICVAPQAQGLGVGSRLLRAFEHRVDALDIPAYLVTDRVDNDATNRFYVSSGWRLAGSYETPQGRAMSCYVHDTSEESA